MLTGFSGLTGFIFIFSFSTRRRLELWRGKPAVVLNFRLRQGYGVTRWRVKRLRRDPPSLKLLRGKQDGVAKTKGTKSNRLQRDNGHLGIKVESVGNEIVKSSRLDALAFTKNLIQKIIFVQVFLPFSMPSDAF